MVFAPSSISYYLHYSVTFHFIERKSIIHCTNVDGCLLGLYDMGEDGGEELYILFQWMPHCQALGVKRKENRSFSNTHMHTDCILIILFPVCMSFFLCRSLVSKSWHRSSNYPKAQKAHIHIQLTCECLTYRSRILPSVYLLLTSSFQMHCQLSGSTMKWCQSKTQKFCTETFSAPIL